MSQVASKSVLLPHMEGKRNVFKSLSPTGLALPSLTARDDSKGTPGNFVKFLVPGLAPEYAALTLTPKLLFL